MPYLKKYLINPQLYHPLLWRGQGERSYFKKNKTRHYLLPITYAITSISSPTKFSGTMSDNVTLVFVGIIVFCIIMLS